jgi:hypothetical protein
MFPKTMCALAAYKFWFYASPSLPDSSTVEIHPDDRAAR